MVILTSVQMRLPWLCSHPPPTWLLSTMPLMFVVPLKLAIPLIASFSHIWQGRLPSSLRAFVKCLGESGVCPRWFKALRTQQWPLGNSDLAFFPLHCTSFVRRAVLNVDTQLHPGPDSFYSETLFPGRVPWPAGVKSICVMMTLVLSPEPQVHVPGCLLGISTC